MSKKVTLKMGEVLTLQQELGAMLREKLSLVVKMDVHKLLSSIDAPIKVYSDLRLEFFKKHGTEKEDGSYELPKDLSKELKKELDDLFEKEEKIITALKFDSFKDLTSDFPYYVFFKLFN